MRGGVCKILRPGSPGDRGKGRIVRRGEYPKLFLGETGILPIRHPLGIGHRSIPNTIFQKLNPKSGRKANVVRRAVVVPARVGAVCAFNSQIQKKEKLYA
jgi:hypothetical protein